jgi:Calcineurin-like phosphoesterase
LPVPNDFKFYKSATGLGGAIGTTQILHATANNLFTVIPASERVTGKDYYQLMYLKHTGTDVAKGFRLWLSSKTLSVKTHLKWALDPAGKNGTGVTIANINTAPAGISTWNPVAIRPANVTVPNFSPNDTVPIWLWRNTEATPSDFEFFGKADDSAVFTFEFDIVGGVVQPPPTPPTPPGGGGGGGGGGNPPPPNPDYKIAVVGDWGCETETQEVHDLIETGGYDFVIGVGDNAYESASCWTNIFSDFKPNFRSAYGNHEYSESGGISPYTTFFGDSLTYFNFTFNNIYFIVMDTNISTSTSSTQFGKVSQWLTEANANTAIDWIVVIMHHPWYVAGSHNPSNEFNQVQNYHTLFVQKHVHFVCCGHNHNWQRTHQIAYSGTVTAPTIIDNTTPYSAAAAGLIHVVSGTGGHDSGTSLYDLPSAPSFQAYQSRLYNGIWEIQASNNGQTWTCQFRNLDDQVFDTFNISQ